MKMYMLTVCILLVFYQTPAKCTKNSEKLAIEEIEFMLTNSCEGSPSTRERSQSSLPLKKRRIILENDNQSIPIRKKKNKYLGYSIVQPHKREMTAEFEALLIEKELVLESDSEFEWEDLYKYPLEGHKKYWNDFCGKLWAGIPGHSAPGYPGVPLKFCVASFFLLDGITGKTHFKGFRHDYDSEADKNVWPFTADFICCDCKYILAGRSNRAVPRSRRYFFGMKIGEKEYFLLTKVQNMKEKSLAQSGYLLKVVDYVNLLETGNIHLNTDITKSV